MAVTSIYKKFIEDHLPQIATAVATKYNGKDQVPSYLHKELLTKKRSYNGRWDSISKSVALIMADYVTTNNAVPLKSRDSLSVAGGKIHKVGVEYWLDEEQIQLLSFIRNNPATTEQEIAKILFEDLPRVIAGVLERIEDTFLTAASNGFALVDSDNVGIGVRMNYGYKTANQIGVSKLWTDPTATPLNDLDRALKLVKTNRCMLLDRTAIAGIFSNAEARAYFGFISKWFGDASSIPNLTDEAVVTVIKDKFKLTDVIIVDRETVYEIDGQRSTKVPWKDGTIGLYPSRNLGALAWSQLAEANDKIENYTYATVDEYILVSMWREGHPFLTEHTKSQALAVPVIENGDKVVTIDTKTVQA